jgi:excisionase family DNA binding protein
MNLESYMTDREPTPSFYKIEEVADQLGISLGSAYSAARTGDIPTVRIGKLLRVPARFIRDARGE